MNNNANCDTITAQNSCDAVDGCTWCKSAAVKSSCKTIDEAKALPPSIFACDKLQDEELIMGEEGPHPHPHPRRHHHCCAAPLIFIALLTVHMYFLFKLSKVHAQEQELGIAKEERKCWRNKKCKKAVLEAQSARRSSISSASSAFEYTICDHTQTQQVPVVTAPA